jgi:adenine-specific DNA-methyltransferase
MTQGESQQVYRRLPMSGSGLTPRFKTLQGLVRAFRRWALGADVPAPANVAGANSTERHILAALGGVAAAIGGEHVGSWPKPIRIWTRTAPTLPQELTDAVHQVLSREEDPLAALYEVSISAANRRRLGTVFTPKPLVDHMLQLAAKELGGPPACVIDAGAGVGAFTVAAARRWPSARILAVDVNVVTLGLLAARIAFEINADTRHAKYLRKIELVHGDYFDQLRQLFRPGAKGPILALGNPPYTRIQELAEETRQKAVGLSDGIIDNGHANLAVLFQAATLRFMREQDVSCMVLPGSFSYTRASRGLRRTLWKSRRHVEVQRTPAATRAFTGRSVQAAIVLVGSERKRRTPLRLARVRLQGNSLEVIDSKVRPRQGKEPDNWFWTAEDVRVDDRIPLSEIATVRRGVATGSNKMFFLTDVVAKSMPRKVRVRGIPSLRGFADGELDAKKHRSHGGPAGRRWLLAIPPDYRLTGSVRDYVRRHEPDVRDRYLVASRDPWYSISDLPRPQLLVSPLSKGDFKVVINRIEAVPSNNLFGVSLRNGADPQALARWLRSKEGQQELRRVSRRYHGGSHKLEPGALAAAQVPKTLQFAH